MGDGQIAWLFTLVAGILVIVLPCKWALAPLFVTIFSIPPAQQIIVGGLHFPITRILILFGWSRLCIRRQERLSSSLNTIDKTVIIWIVLAICTYTILWQSGNAFVNRLGFAFDALGIYFLVKWFIKDASDIQRVIRMLAVISIAVAISMIIERLTGRNVFAILGGVPMITEVRSGRMRCQGAFLHSIMAGSFGASLFPLAFFLLWSSRKHRVLGMASVAATAIITWTSSSSGPVLSYIAGILGLCVWPFRRQMRTIRWGILLGIVSLHLVMKAPVWDLIGRVNVFSSSSAYHREMLMDEFIGRFDQWWLLGTKSTKLWSANFLVPTDITNQFLRVGADGGFFTMILFILVIALCFRATGRARKTFVHQSPMQKLSWALGTSLFVNVIAFLGCSYWDQVIILWYTLLALISSLSGLPTIKRPARKALELPLPAQEAEVAELSSPTS